MIANSPRQPETSTASGRAPAEAFSTRVWTLPGFDVREVRAERPAAIDWHEHDRPGLAVVLDNEYEQLTARRSFTCRRNDLTLIPAAVPHREEIAAGTWGLLVFPRLDDGLSCGPVDLESCFDRWERIRPSVTSPASELRHELSQVDAVTPLALEARLLDMVVGLARERRRRRAREQTPPWLLEVHGRLHEEYDRPLTVAGLAAETGVTATRLARAYRRRFRSSIGDTVRQLRLGRARELLADSSRPIADIALEVGFYDQSHLNRRFRQRYGETPLGFRERVRNT